jgi:hypothetical protein
MYIKLFCFWQAECLRHAVNWTASVTFTAAIHEYWDSGVYQQWEEAWSWFIRNDTIKLKCLVIQHLLLEVPYTVTSWNLAHILPNTCPCTNYIYDQEGLLPFYLLSPLHVTFLWQATIFVPSCQVRTLHFENYYLLSPLHIIFLEQVAIFVPLCQVRTLHFENYYLLSPLHITFLEQAAIFVPFCQVRTLRSTIFLAHYT